MKTTSNYFERDTHTCILPRKIICIYVFLMMCNIIELRTICEPKQMSHIFLHPWKYIKRTYAHYYDTKLLKMGFECEISVTIIVLHVSRYT